tara:strand:- start:440 stop:586 length:147 start_codon:yes stop_codon:yes gene_type:complete
MTVYLAVIGAYLDYLVLGAYTSKERAEARLKEYEDYFFPHVEEFELGE